MSTSLDWRQRESKHLALAAQESVHGSLERAEAFYRVAAICAEQARAEEKAEPGLKGCPPVMHNGDDCGTADLPPYIELTTPEEPGMKWLMCRGCRRLF